MNLTDLEQRALRQVIESGISKSTAQLARISGTAWNISTVGLDIGYGERFRAILASDRRTCYGAHFTMPRGKFLVIFPPEDARAVVNSFLRDSGDRVKTMADLEENTLAEISNILANAVAGALADAGDMALILSTPDMKKGIKEDLFKCALEDFGYGKEGTAMMAYVHMSSPALSSDCVLILFLDSTFITSMLENMGY